MTATIDRLLHDAWMDGVRASIKIIREKIEHNRLEDILEALEQTAADREGEKKCRLTTP